MHFRACGSRRARLGGRLKPGEEVTGFFGTPSLTRRRGDWPLGRGTSSSIVSLSFPSILTLGFEETIYGRNSVRGYPIWDSSFSYDDA